MSDESTAAARFVCVACQSTHSNGDRVCPTCGGILALSGYVEAATQRAEKRSREVLKQRATIALAAWERARVKRVEIAFGTIVAAALVAVGVHADWQRPLLTAAVVVAGLLVSERLHRLSQGAYHALQFATDQGGHRCLQCGNRGTYTKRSLLGGTHVHCVWCRAQLYSQ